MSIDICLQVSLKTLLSPKAFCAPDIPKGAPYSLSFPSQCALFHMLFHINWRQLNFAAKLLVRTISPLLRYFSACTVVSEQMSVVTLQRLAVDRTARFFPNKQNCDQQT